MVLSCTIRLDGTVPDERSQMPSPKINAKTGSATVIKQGHTSDNKHGSNPNAKVKGGSSVRDLSAK